MLSKVDFSLLGGQGIDKLSTLSSGSQQRVRQQNPVWSRLKELVTFEAPCR